MAKQNRNASDYSTHASFVPAMASAVVRLLNPKQEDRILDVGCGEGQLTEEIAKCGCSVIGIDSSSSMIEAARARGLSGHVMNADHLEYHKEFDAVFTNAARQRYSRRLSRAEEKWPVRWRIWRRGQYRHVAPGNARSIRGPSRLRTI